MTGQVPARLPAAFPVVARMICAPGDLGSAPVFASSVALDDGHGEIVRATLALSALGVVEARIGGRQVGDEVLAPGWSSYEWRIRYRTHEVTSMISGPEVELTLLAGNGWAVGRLGWNGGSHFYADRPGVIAELRIDFADGHTQWIGTDGSWNVGGSAVTTDDLLDGMTIDARRYGSSGPLPPTFAAVEVELDPTRLVPQVSPPVRRHELVRPVATWISPAGRTLFDFGQNLVGWVRLTASGTAGDVVTVRHAEVLENGELGTRPLRSAAATDRFILSGSVDVFEPTLTFHGFRYVEVEGATPSGDDLMAVVVHTDVPRIGTFECSNDQINQLHSNAVWSLRGNAVSLPTDCPQRDERLGWTGDLAVVAPTLAFLFDVGDFLDDWLADLAAEQGAAGGRIPYVVPDLLKLDEVPAEFQPVETAAIWGDAAVWVPWALWQAYGNRERLARHLPTMLAHIDHVAGLLSASNLWDTTFQFGDWLDPDAPPDRPDAAKADRDVVATAAFLQSITLTEMAAQAVGDGEAALRLAALVSRVTEAFRTTYVTDDGRIRSDCQTVYALALTFGLLDPQQRESAGRRLAELVEADDGRIATGFAGTPFILEALTLAGRSDLAYRMLLQPEVPGWMYQVRMGATTMWERWDSMLPDGTINPGEMTSFNHYAFGSVAQWLHSRTLGLRVGDPGYATVVIEPTVGGGLTWARGTLLTPHGEVEVSWRLDEDRLTLDVATAPQVPARVRLPGSPEIVHPGGRATYSTAISQEEW